MAQGRKEFAAPEPTGVIWRGLKGRDEPRRSKPLEGSEEILDSASGGALGFRLVHQAIRGAEGILGPASRSQ